VFLIFVFVALFLFFTCCAWRQSGTLSWKRLTAVIVFLAALYYGESVFAESDTGKTLRTFKLIASTLTEVLTSVSRSLATEKKQGEQSQEWNRTKGPDEFRNKSAPQEENPMTVKENIQLKATPTHIHPGESIVLEAFCDSDTKNLGNDLLVIYVNRGKGNGVLPIRRVGKRHYRETVRFKETESGVFDYGIAVPDLQNNTSYVSNKVRVLVAPDVKKQELVDLRFSDNTLRSTVGMKEVLDLYGYGRKGERYNLAIPAIGTVYRFEDESLATVTEEGLLHVLAPGKTTLHASYQSLSTSVEVDIDPRPTLPPTKTNPEDRPAAPIVISPVEGTVVERETKVYFEVTPFDTSKGHRYQFSSWSVIDERGRDRASLNNESERATWIPPLSGSYRWRMMHEYEGSPFNADDSYYTPWTTLIVVPNSQDVKKE
jgi:hypothetical protein